MTINNIGERAGNASLKDVVIAFNCCGEQVMGCPFMGIITKYITMASTMIKSRIIFQVILGDQDHLKDGSTLSQTGRLSLNFSSTTLTTLNTSIE